METVEEEAREAQTNREIDQAKSDVDSAAMLAPHDPEVKRLQGELLGANARNIDPNKLRQVSQQAKEEAGKAIAETTAKGVLALSGLGAVLVSMGVLTDGKHYHPEDTGTGELPNNIAGLPNRERESQQQHIFQ